MSADSFFDTSVLVYAFDKSDAAKHEACLKFISKILDKDERAVISSQILLELYNVITRDISNPISLNEAASIINDFADADNWTKLDYNLSTAIRAIEIARKHRTKIWDTLIAETMKEYDIDTIVTENEKDFKKIPGLKVINPFK